MFSSTPQAGAQYGAPGPMHANPGAQAIYAASQAAQPYARPQTKVRTVAAQNLAADTPDDVIRRTFAQYGSFDAFRVVAGATPGTKVAYAKFKAIEQAAASLQLHGSYVGTSVAVVQLCAEDMADDPPEAPRPPEAPAAATEPPLLPIEQWEALPAHPPQNKDLEKRIDTMADWYNNDVPKFLELYEKKKGDPAYGFMYDQHADGVAYYNWKVFCVKQKWTSGQIKQALFKYQIHCYNKNQGAAADGTQPSSAPDQRAAVPGADDAKEFSADELRECRQYLDNVGTSQASIQAAKDWMLARITKARTLLSVVHQKISETKDTTKRINLLYLISDVLYASNLHPQLSAAFTRMIPSIFQQSCLDQTEENLAFLRTLIDNWRQGQTLDNSTLATLTDCLSAEIARQDQQRKGSAPQPSPVAPAAPTPAAMGPADVPPQQPWGAQWPPAQSQSAAGVSLAQQQQHLAALNQSIRSSQLQLQSYQAAAAGPMAAQMQPAIAATTLAIQQAQQQIQAVQAQIAALQAVAMPAATGAPLGMGMAPAPMQPFGAQPMPYGGAPGPAPYPQMHPQQPFGQMPGAPAPNYPQGPHYPMPSMAPMPAMQPLGMPGPGPPGQGSMYGPPSQPNGMGPMFQAPEDFKKDGPFTRTFASRSLGDLRAPEPDPLGSGPFGKGKGDYGKGGGDYGKGGGDYGKGGGDYGKGGGDYGKGGGDYGKGGGDYGKGGGDYGKAGGAHGGKGSSFDPGKGGYGGRGGGAYDHGPGPSDGGGLSYGAKGGKGAPGGYPFSDRMPPPPESPPPDFGGADQHHYSAGGHGPPDFIDIGAGKGEKGKGGFAPPFGRGKGPPGFGRGDGGGKGADDAGRGTFGWGKGAEGRGRGLGPSGLLLGRGKGAGEGKGGFDGGKGSFDNGKGGFEPERPMFDPGLAGGKGMFDGGKGGLDNGKGRGRGKGFFEGGRGGFDGGRGGFDGGKGGFDLGQAAPAFGKGAPDFGKGAPSFGKGLKGRGAYTAMAGPPPFGLPPE